MSDEQFWFEIIVTLIVAFGITLALIPLARFLAVKFDAIDYPGVRRVNMRPVARLGGVAMFGGMIASVCAILVGIIYFGFPNPFTAHPDLQVNYLGVGLGLLVMFIVGLIDDLKDLKPKQKLFGQIISASIIAASGLLLADIMNPFGNGYIEFVHIP